MAQEVNSSHRSNSKHLQSTIALIPYTSEYNVVRAAMKLLCLLEITLLPCKAVEGLIPKTLAAHKAAQSNGIAFSCQDAILIHAANVDLHRGVVFRSD